MKIIDAHSHWMPPEVAERTTFYRQGWSDLDGLIRGLDAAGIERAVLLYPSSDAHMEMGGWAGVCAVYNKQIAQAVAAHPDRLIGAGIIPADLPGQMLAEMDRIRDLGLSCISLASSYDGRFLDDGVFLPVFEKAEKEKTPLFIHPQIMNPIGFERVDDPLLMPVVEYLFDMTMGAGKMMMAGTFARFPELKFVFAHFAGVMPFLTDRFDTTYAMLRQRQYVKDLGAPPSAIMRNIYVDTSGVRSATMIRMAIEAFGADKILWGSDYPAKKDLPERVDVVGKMDIPEGDKAGILAGNLEKVFSAD